MENVGRTIWDWYCGGFVDDDRHDMTGATIIMEGGNWIFCITEKKEPVLIEFLGGWEKQKQEIIEEWCKPSSNIMAQIIMLKRGLITEEELQRR